MVKLKHFYECNLKEIRDERDYRNYAQSQLSFDVKFQNVFHVIEVFNNTSTPFTSGSLMVVDQDQQPLAQDMLQYIGAKQSGLIKLSESPDIRVKEQEKITAVQEKAKKMNGNGYNLLTIESEVEITNSKNESVSMSINKVVLGNSIKSSIQLSSQKMPNSNNVNLLDVLKFNLDVKAGETYKFTYTYQLYTNN